jgi:hypothetical protein
MEPHDRGEILVLAVYDAFRAIVERRTADLIRIATDGSGLLPKGALHPDLVERLTAETCKAAQQVLNICIRALDYVPAVDITFGEYLRALITADVDLVPDDPLGYRVAFMEAFRNRGIPVHNVKTISTESLTWNAPENDIPDWLREALEGINFNQHRYLSRAELAEAQETSRRAVHEALKKAFAKDPNLCRHFGIEPGIARYNTDGKVLKEAAAGNTTFDVFRVRGTERIGPNGRVQQTVQIVIAQRKPLPLDPDVPDGPFFWFRGGSTLIVERRGNDLAIRYMIMKRIDSERRVEIQRATARGTYLSPLRALYLGSLPPDEPFAMMHADEHGSSQDWAGKGGHDHG